MGFGTFEAQYCLKYMAKREPYDTKTQAWIDDADTYAEKLKRRQRAKYLKHGHKYRSRQKEQYDVSSEKILARNAQYRAEHPEEVSASKMAWEHQDKLKNPEKYRKKAAEYHIANREKRLAQAKLWRKLNPAKNAAKQAAYKFRKARATPPWANEFFISEAYELAALRSSMTNIEWEVDHIMPLCGRDICGLHVETNLQVIPKLENRRKHARGWKQYVNPSHLC
jgi:hypothetical protein